MSEFVISFVLITELCATAMITIQTRNKTNAKIAANGIISSPILPGSIANTTKTAIASIVKPNADKRIQSVRFDQWFLCSSHKGTITVAFFVMINARIA